MPTARLAIAAAVALPALALLGCATEQAPPDGAGAVRVTLYWPQVPSGNTDAPMQVEARGSEVSVRVIPASTETIELTVAGPGISPDITRVISKSDVQNDVATVVLYIPPGTSRTISASAKSAGGSVVASGSSTVTVVAGVETQAIVEMTQGSMVFATNRDGNFEIYTMAGDGTGAVNLTNDAAYDGWPDWSPDAAMIVFASDRDGCSNLWAMDADGSNPTELTSNADTWTWFYSPRWSPDGSKIAFERSSVLTSDVWVMDADGSNPTNLTNLVGNFFCDDPSWSPDGSFIVFGSDRDDDLLAEWDNEVYRMDSDGADVVRLTLNKGDDHYPSVSPDGTKIAYVSAGDVGGIVMYWDIYVMDFDGSSQTRTTSSQGKWGAPAWSPDGSRIAWSELAGMFTPAEIYVMDADGGNPVQITSNAFEDVLPCWRPGS